jgi:hypothetical protein
MSLGRHKVRYSVIGAFAPFLSQFISFLLVLGSYCAYHLLAFCHHKAVISGLCMTEQDNIFDQSEQGSTNF